MKLDTLHRQLAVPDGHNGAVVRLSGDLKHVGH